MKLNIWIEICPWDIGNDGELKQIPYIRTSPFDYPCSENIKRFKAEIEIPYEYLPTIELNKSKAEEIGG